MHNFRLPPIYPITDIRISGLSHREQAGRLIAGGAQIIQLRDKHATPREFYEAAKETLMLTRKHNVPLIINDRVDVALALRADGIHLGQDDLPPERARELLGHDAIIGFSTHSVEQAITAAESPVDYIAIGPIFTTGTKDDPDPVVGLSGIKAVKAAVTTLPVAAIGGIDARNVASVFEAGADSAAVISSLLSDGEQIEHTMQEFTDLLANIVKPR